MYKNYTWLSADHLTYFGGSRSHADTAGAFYLPVDVSSTDSNSAMGSRLIKFGD